MYNRQDNVMYLITISDTWNAKCVTLMMPIPSSQYFADCVTCTKVLCWLQVWRIMFEKIMFNKINRKVSSALSLIGKIGAYDSLIDSGAGKGTEWANTSSKYIGHIIII